ncbi:hypothetical protein [Fictibacillus barbaricus]|uniref:F0F1-type ATP synthase membrane subunit b/b n=1 Tax=Fictibacillus barbaricus TaxID=182136 RepID=A0ABU1U1S6_9BACL|nr:hypothetical protein [Fictibacillus barbaricus]MDR7073433.1 F0F1-type ATP synthase membrane subunit b/b' [Fictibacillus barbaricus]
MEISRKEKFSSKKKNKSKKLPKVLMASLLATALGTTSAFAAKPELADQVYTQILAFTFKSDIQNQLKQQKDDLLKNLSSQVKSVFSETKTELDNKKKDIIEEKKTDLQNHYNDEIANITKRKQEAVNKVTQDMKNEAATTSESYKKEITDEIEKEIKKQDINK